MLRYVEEEVERVKGLFEQKEARLTSERDSAKTAAQQLAREQEELTQTLQKLKQELQHLPGALEVLRALPDIRNRKPYMLARCVLSDVLQALHNLDLPLKPSKLFMTTGESTLFMAVMPRKMLGLRMVASI